MTLFRAGESLGDHVLAGAGKKGVFEMVSDTRILFDGRQFFVNYHMPHGTHNLQGPNEYGENTNYAQVIAFGDGFLCKNDVFHRSQDPDWSPVTDVYTLWTCFDKNGDVKWQRRIEYDDLDVPAYDANTGATVDGHVQATYFGLPNRRDCILIAGNQQGRVLWAIKSHHKNGAVWATRYYHLDFDATGAFTATFLRDVDDPADFQNIDRFYPNFSGHDQFIAGTGYVVAPSMRTGGSHALLLTADLEWVGTLPLPPLTGPATTGYKHPEGIYTDVSTLPGYGNDKRPVFVTMQQDPSTNDKTAKVWAIDFDGETAATTTQIDTVPLGQIGNDYMPAKDGIFEIIDWDTGAGPKPANTWTPYDKSDGIPAPNPGNMETVYTTSADSDAYIYGPAGVISTVVADWYDQTPITSPYNGDHWSQWYTVNRFSWVDWKNREAGCIDVLLVVPEPPEQSYSWGTGYGDMDMDDAAYATVNPWNNRIFLHHHMYWARHTRNTDLLSGQCWFQQYWIAQGPPKSHLRIWLEDDAVWKDIGIETPDDTKKGRLKMWDGSRWVHEYMPMDGDKDALSPVPLDLWLDWEGKWVTVATMVRYPEDA